MSPKMISFTREQIGSTAVELVRERGWDSLSARNMAEKLGSSVSPVYSAFGSMEALEDHVLATAVGLLQACVSRDFGKKPFLNHGIGLAVFAREEPELFLALYRSGRSRNGAFARFRVDLESSLRLDPLMGGFPEPAFSNIIARMWTYTIGSAVAMIYGYSADPSTEGIAKDLRETGASIIYGELSGIANDESEENKAAWARLLGGLSERKKEEGI